MAFKKLEGMRERYRELEKELYAPGAAGSPDYPQKLREHGTLAKIVPAYEEYLKVHADRLEAEELAGGGDPEMAQLAAEELPGLREREDVLLTDVKRLVA
ncbi:MAG: PCRF domain-containing protein, partial [Planctomycetota bacterium]